MKKNDHPQNPKFSQYFLVPSVQSFAEFLWSFQLEFEDKTDKDNSCQIHNNADWKNKTATIWINTKNLTNQDGQISNLFRMRYEQKSSRIWFFSILMLSWYFFWFEQTKKSTHSFWIYVSRNNINVMRVKRFRILNAKIWCNLNL